MTTPAPWGNPFEISTATGNQDEMKTVALADGSFIAVWTARSGTGADTSGYSIRGQLFNANGSKRGGEFVVNTTIEDGQVEPDIAVLSDGRFVVAWTDYSKMDGESGPGIRARIFNADGTAFNRTGAANGDADFLVNSTKQDGVQRNPSIAALANGGFVIGFQSDGIRAQVFDAQGIHSGAEVLVNLETTGTQTNPAVIASENGYTVFYQSHNSGFDRVLGRTIYTDGRDASAEFLVSSPGIRSLAPITTKLSDGRFIVIWYSLLPDEGSPDLISSNRAQIYNADGTKSGGEFSVKGSDASYQGIYSVAPLPTGGFAVAFWSTMTDPSSGSIYDVGVSFFDANGNKTSTDTKVSQIPFEISELINISTLADGRVVVTSASVDSENDINLYGQIVDGRTAAISLPGTSRNDEYYGTAFNDTMNGADGNDKLVGEAGDDVLNGGAGIDAMIGGLGNDTYHVDAPADQITELAGGGTDTVVSSISYALSAELENLIGSGSGALRLTGNAAANAITGADGKDRLDGGLGKDTLSGGYGNDVLIGGKGKDVFVFASKLGTHKTDRKVNFDTISDFKPREDKIHLENAIFTKLKKTGKLDKAYFTIGDKAKDRNDYIVYDKEKGILSYDPDGSGSKKAIEFAKVKANLNLTAADFIVI
ncbi:calcium-binding protein [Microvirga flavescens]|uniref:calcium-binding protein n=1 Tax=Microvirga flavescens TaxID=2249811 RepID=UPI000DD97039|nr:calcium-binding protein [Microvirga flavescens]